MPFLLGLIAGAGVVHWVLTIMILSAADSPVCAIITLVFPPARVVTSFIATPMLGVRHPDRVRGRTLAASGREG